jgi:16S rRNA (guanine527-N7)-methyltransferase
VIDDDVSSRVVSMRQSRPPGPEDLAADRATALALTPVSRETAERLDRFVALLLQRQQTTQLIASSTEPHLWTRHVADSLQLIDLVPRAKVWVDLGSGGGFPGIVLACALADTAGAQVHLVESSSRKAAFLSQAICQLGVPGKVHAARIENVVDSLAGHANVVTARALAPLTTLLGLSYGLIAAGAVGLFPKGQDVEAELIAASRDWDMQPELVQSRTEPRARIVKLVRVARRPTTS